MTTVNRKGIAWALLTAFISGVSIFINKLVVVNISPYLLVGIKNSLVTLFLLSSFLMFKQVRLLKLLKLKQWLYLMLIGLLGGSIPFLMFFKGLSLTTAYEASFIHKSMFLLVLPLATFFLKEKLNKNFFWAAVILLISNLLLLQKLEFSFSKGNGLVLLATIFWAMENTISKKLLTQSMPARTLAFGRMFFGSLFIWIYLNLNLVPDQTSINSGQIIGIAITSILLMFYVVSWYQAIKYTQLTTALSILLLGGPITSLLTVIFLPGSASVLVLTSGLLTIIGISILTGKKTLSYFWQKIISSWRLLRAN